MCVCSRTPFPLKPGDENYKAPSFASIYYKRTVCGVVTQATMPAIPLSAPAPFQCLFRLLVFCVTFNIERGEEARDTMFIVSGKWTGNGLI